MASEEAFGHYRAFKRLASASLHQLKAKRYRHLALSPVPLSGRTASDLVCIRKKASKYYAQITKSISLAQLSFKKLRVKSVSRNEESQFLYQIAIRAPVQITDNKGRTNKVCHNTQRYYSSSFSSSSGDRQSTLQY